MLKLLVLILLGFQLWAVKPATSARSQEPISATALAFVVIPSGFVRRRREFELFEAEEAPEDNLQYGAWGEVKNGNTSGNSPPFGYTGRWGGYTDARLGKVLNWNRWYGPQAGRWGSRDLWGIWGGSNLYQYVGGNPVLHTDRWGLVSPTPTISPSPSITPTLTQGPFPVSPMFPVYPNSPNEEPGYLQCVAKKLNLPTAIAKEVVAHIVADILHHSCPIVGQFITVGSVTLLTGEVLDSCAECYREMHPEPEANLRGTPAVSPTLNPSPSTSPTPTAGPSPTPTKTARAR